MRIPFGARPVFRCELAVSLKGGNKTDTKWGPLWGSSGLRQDGLVMRATNAGHWRSSILVNSVGFPVANWTTFSAKNTGWSPRNGVAKIIVHLIAAIPFYQHIFFATQHSFCLSHCSKKTIWMNMFVAGWWFLTPLKNISQIGLFPQVGVNVTHIWVATT